MAWPDLTARQRALVVGIGVIELIMTARAARDLARRTPAEIRGPRPLWAAALVVQPVGPLAYLAWGRRRGSGSR